MDGPANIMVVDDDENLLVTLAAILEEEGYQVFPCQSGLKALRCLTTNLEDDPIDLVVCDLKLPDTTGLQVLSEVKEVSPDTPSC